MGFLYKKAPSSIASIRIEQLKAMREQTIDLYPEEKKKPERYAFDTFREVQQIRELSSKCALAFRENVTNTITSNAIYYGLLEDVMNELLFNSHQKAVVANMTRKFVEDTGAANILRDSRYKNLYLAEMTILTEKAIDTMCSKAKCKMKEGLSEKDAYDIEDQDVNDFIINIRDRIPKDITKTITDRVQDSIDDFVETNRQNKLELKKIYDNTKSKIEELKNREASQNDMYNPSPDSPEALEQMKEEYISRAKAQEMKLLEQEFTVFDAISRIILESVHSVSVLKEAYSNKYNNIKYDKIVDDATAIYTFLETLNAFDIIRADRDYLKKTLNEMRNSISETDNMNGSVGTEYTGTGNNASNNQVRVTTTKPNPTQKPISKTNPTVSPEDMAKD